jgi:hypothetical protein
MSQYMDLNEILRDFLSTPIRTSAGSEVTAYEGCWRKTAYNPETSTKAVLPLKIPDLTWSPAHMETSTKAILPLKIPDLTWSPAHMARCVYDRRSASQ